MTDFEQLYYDIAYCPATCQEKGCQKLIKYNRGEGDNRCAEPVAGHLETARFMLIGKNPGTTGKESLAPHLDDILTQKQVFNHFCQYIDRHIPYYDNLKWGANHLGVPDKLYCATNCVHCKSKGSVGVNSALVTCISKWMPSILENAKNLKVIGLAGAVWNY